MSQIMQDDTFVQVLRALPRVEVDTAHAARLRERCRRALEHPPQTNASSLEPATVGAVCAIYAWEIVRTVIR